MPAVAGTAHRPSTSRYLVIDTAANEALGMNPWNYRLVAKTSVDEEGHSWVEMAVHHAYYTQPTDSHPQSISSEPATAVAETVEDLRLDLAKMLEAFGRPILAYETFDVGAKRNS